mmetsp:Transcript_26720/g.54447  ORF Transcript_26720/g.54447 Transcript_26720/m.54447 type:complete len:214 (+) Transcript_26720:539-1180(+)
MACSELGGDDGVLGDAELRGLDLGAPDDDERGVDEADETEHDGARGGEEADDAAHGAPALMHLRLELLDVDVVPHAQRLQPRHVLRELLVAVHLAQRALVVLQDLLLLAVLQVAAAAVLDAQLVRRLAERVFHALGEGLGVVLGVLGGHEVGERRVEGDGDAARDDELDVELVALPAVLRGHRRCQVRVVLPVQPPFLRHLRHHRIEGLRQIY